MFDLITSLLFHVYILYTVNGVFYVGCGDVKRLKGTLVPDPRYHSKKDKKLLECFAKGEVIHQAIIFSTDNRKEALHVEMKKCQCCWSGCNRIAKHLIIQSVFVNSQCAPENLACESHAHGHGTARIVRSNASGFAAHRYQSGTFGWVVDYAAWEDRDNREAYR